SLALISTLSAIALIVLDMMKLKGRLNGDFFCVSVRDDDDDDKKKKKEKTERRVGVKGSLNRDPENDEDESTPFLKQGGEDNGLRRRGVSDSLDTSIFPPLRRSQCESTICDASTYETQKN
ncbi:hypothetical protein OAV88_04230, partial [bacterium]|nr:hypothetical protein [bacterium]